MDDALSTRQLPNGLIEVGVHIADVSHFVRKVTPSNTALHYGPCCLIACPYVLIQAFPDALVGTQQLQCECKQCLCSSKLPITAVYSHWYYRHRQVCDRGD